MKKYFRNGKIEQKKVQIDEKKWGLVPKKHENK